MFGFKRRKTEGHTKPLDLKFFEVEVAPDEMWTIWNKERMPLVFPTHTFSRFVNLALGEKAYSKYAVANVSSRITSHGDGAKELAHETLVQAWEALDRELVAWREYTLDRYVSLPTFSFFGDDAVKAVRAVVSANSRQTTGGRGWSEVPVSIRSKGTILYGRRPLDDHLDPEFCIPHRSIKCVVGTAWGAQAYLDDSILDVIQRTFTDLSPATVSSLVNKSQTSEFTLTLIRNFLDNFELDRSADWRNLTAKYIPAHLKWTDIVPDGRIPDIDPRSTHAEFLDQVWNLILWAYQTGILCRVYMWIDGQFGARLVAQK